MVHNKSNLNPNASCSISPFLTNITDKPINIVMSMLDTMAISCLPWRSNPNVTSDTKFVLNPCAKTFHAKCITYEENGVIGLIYFNF